MSGSLSTVPLASQEFVPGPHLNVDVPNVIVTETTDPRLVMARPSWAASDACARAGRPCDGVARVSVVIPTLNESRTCRTSDEAARSSA